MSFLSPEKAGSSRENRKQESFEPDQWMYPSLRKQFLNLVPVDSSLGPLEKIGRQDWNGLQKNLYARVLLKWMTSAPEQPDEGKGRKKTPLRWEKKLSQWPKSRDFKEEAAQFEKDIKEQFQVAGLLSCMSAVLVFLFIWAVILDRYLVNFSVDALVGVAAFFFMVHNLIMQFRLIRLAESPNRYILLDGLAFVVAFLARLWLPTGFDVSVVLFVITFFIEKKWFDQAVSAQISHLI